MSRILMVTWDGGGNAPPMLNIGRELQRRAHDVNVLGHAAQRDRIERAGLAFVPYRHARAFSRIDPYEDFSVFLKTFLDPGAGDDVRELVDEWSPDLAVVDCLMLGALQAAQACGLPTVVLVHSFWGHYGERFPQGPVTQLGAPHGRSPLQLWEAATEVLVASDRTLDPAQGPIPSNVRWTGVAQPRAVPAARADRSHILLSLSTVWFPGQQESMQQILDALAGLPVRVTATIDHSVTAKRLRIPANVDAYGYVDHAVVMPEVALVISHGGHATTMYSLAHDLPVLVVSQHSKLDQPLIGQVLERHHAGITLDQYPELSDMQAATTELLESDSAANAAAQIGARLREQNGSSNASDRIEASVGIGAAT